MDHNFGPVKWTMWLRARMVETWFQSRPPVPGPETGRPQILIAFGLPAFNFVRLARCLRTQTKKLPTDRYAQKGASTASAVPYLVYRLSSQMLRQCGAGSGICMVHTFGKNDRPRRGAATQKVCTMHRWLLDRSAPSALQAFSQSCPLRAMMAPSSMMDGGSRSG